MARGMDGKFISKAQTGGGKSALRMKGSPISLLRKKELRKTRRERRKSLKSMICP
ncbi:MAG: hypothetical protein AAB355_00485 [Patescibacteria group bacterium]